MKQSQSLSNFVIVTTQLVIITIAFKFSYCYLPFSYNNNRVEPALHRAYAVGSSCGLFDSFGIYKKVCYRFD